MNGYYGTDIGNETYLRHGSKLLLLGPNRMDGKHNYNMDVSTLTITDASAFSQNSLGTANYKYTIGTYVDGDGTVVIDLVLTNLDTNKVTTATADTGKTKAEVEALGGNIIMYGCVKGGTTPTTFKYTVPYTK